MQHQRDQADPALLILRVDETINDTSSEEAVENLERMIDEGVDRLIVDFSDVDYVNSFALSILMRLRNRLRPRNGELRLCRTSQQIDKVMDLTSLTPHLPRVATLEDAQEALRVG